MTAIPLKTGRGWSPYHKPMSHYQDMGALFLFGIQTNNVLLLPFFRRGMGSDYWTKTSIFSGVCLMLFAFAVRMLWPMGTLFLGLPLFNPWSFFPHRFDLDKPTYSCRLQPCGYTPYAAWAIIGPFAVFLVLFVVVAIRRRREAMRLTKAGTDHSLSSGMSVLEKLHRKAPSRRVQRFYEPLYAMGAGYLVTPLSPALGILLFYAGIQHFFYARSVWRVLEDQQKEARNLVIHAEHAERVMAEVQDAMLRIKQDLEKSHPEMTITLEELEARLEPELRAKISRLKDGR